MKMFDSDHPRLILHDFLTVDECKELEFIHKSCCTIGYRPGVFSTTLSHLIATECSHLIVPFVPIRDRLKDKVEEFFGCQFELFVEFTGLISWCQGASIGWHSDDNKTYLKQRDFAVVCYLNDYGTDFHGGLFHFQSGEPTTVVPKTGEAIMYTADSRNIHSVDEVISGERLTLTLWFTRDQDYDEDAKLIKLLSQGFLNPSLKEPDQCIPIPAPSNMYWCSSDQANDSQRGFNICWGRIHAFGYDLYPHQDGCSSELFMEEPLQLVRQMELCELVFHNILHILQVVQFYNWKRFEFQPLEVEGDRKRGVISCSKTHQEKVIKLRSLYVADHQMEETLLLSRGFKYNNIYFDWAAIYASAEAWRKYSIKLERELRMSLPLWLNEQSLFVVSVDKV